VYIDDRLEFPNQLHVYARTADRAHARILRIDTTPCYAFEGVRIAITHEDIPGLKDIGPVVAGDPLLAIDKVEFVGQPVLAVAARDLETARKRPWPRSSNTKTWSRCWTWSKPCAKALRARQPHPPARRFGCRPGQRPHRIQGTLHIGGQEHFYLETQISSVMPTEDGGMIVYCSTQNPTEVQKLVAEVLDVPMNKVVVDMRRMGGGFGGKETQAASPACLCAVSRA
jgi:xanthine dehydrogenase large subunit